MNKKAASLQRKKKYKIVFMNKDREMGTYNLQIISSKMQAFL